MIGIYKITNKQNGKVYIGQATNIERRLSEHKQKRIQTIDSYINVLGIENFDFDILEECSLKELDKKEQEYINFYDSQKKGYNIQKGGFNNSLGEGNGRAKLTEELVVQMRQAYANHESPKAFYESIKYTGITRSSFQAVWQGQSWTHIMPEVFTKENKNYYIKDLSKKENSLFSKEEVLKYRKYYVHHSAKEVYELICKDKGSDYAKLSTVKKMLCGDGNQNNYYQSIPIYKKKEKQWYLNNEPVTTILGSEE